MSCRFLQGINNNRSFGYTLMHFIEENLCCNCSHSFGRIEGNTIYPLSILFGMYGLIISSWFDYRRVEYVF